MFVVVVGEKDVFVGSESFNDIVVVMRLIKVKFGFLLDDAVVVVVVVTHDVICVVVVVRNVIEEGTRFSFDVVFDNERLTVLSAVAIAAAIVVVVVVAAAVVANAIFEEHIVEDGGLALRCER